MSLIAAEQDDAAVLRAEDEAIAEAEAGEQAEPAIPTGGSLAQLIEELTSGPVQPSREG